MHTESKGTTGEGASSPANQVDEAAKTPLLEILRGAPRLRLFAVIGLGILFLVGLIGALAAWYFGYPWLWQYGFSPLSWKAIPAGFGMLFLAYAAGVPYLPLRWLNHILQLYVDEQEEAELTRVWRTEQAKLEAFEKQLAEEDQAHLVTILQYSQAQLRQYYAIALRQTQRSFRYSVIAMWLGFFILVGGIALYLFPVEQIGLKSPAAGINTLVIGSGAIVEFISALFLWVYRQSMRQLTYFYNRQIHAHNVLFCYRVSDTMGDPDIPKKTIVEHILQTVWSPEGLEATTGKGFLSFIQKSKPASVD